MGLNVGRWVRYAQAKVASAVSTSEEEVARLEAERELEVADKPWLSDDHAAPSFDTARARIEWETAQAQGEDGPTPQPPPHEPATGDGDRTPTPGSSDPIRLPASGDEADAAQARIELDQRAEESAARLDAIRRELGVDQPDADS